MSEILSYGQWTETEGSSLEGLDQIRGYSDYFRTETFSDKSFTDADVNQVDGNLFRLARSRGLLAEDDEAAQEQYTKREPTTADYERVVEHKFYNDEEGASIGAIKGCSFEGNIAGNVSTTSPPGTRTRESRDGDSEVDQQMHRVMLPDAACRAGSWKPALPAARWGDLQLRIRKH